MIVITGLDACLQKTKSVGRNLELNRLCLSGL